MPLKQTSYKDEEGRLKAVLLPDTEDVSNAFMGIPVGPPNLTELGLPVEIEVRLNNELYHRGIFTPMDALRKRSEITAAIQAALKLDTERVVTLYAGKEYRNAKAPENKPNPPVQHRGPRQPSKHS